MSRLTKKFNGEYYHKKAKNLMFNNDTDYNVIQKLGKLEDIEEELGCPLEVFVNIFKYGVIVSDDNYEAKGFSEWQQQNIEIDIKNKCFSVYCIGTWKFRDYRKTWWLEGEKENV